MSAMEKLKMGLFILFWLVVAVGVPVYITLSGPVIIIDCIGDLWIITIEKRVMQ